LIYFDFDFDFECLSKKRNKMFFKKKQNKQTLGELLRQLSLYIATFLPAAAIASLSVVNKNWYCSLLETSESAVCVRLWQRVFVEMHDSASRSELNVISGLTTYREKLLALWMIRRNWKQRRFRKFKYSLVSDAATPLTSVTFVNAGLLMCNEEGSILYPLPDTKTAATRMSSVRLRGHTGGR